MFEKQTKKRIQTRFWLQVLLKYTFLSFALVEYLKVRLKIATYVGYKTLICEQIIEF